MTEKMDFEEIEPSHHALLFNSDSSSNIDQSFSVDSLLDFLRNEEPCSQTHVIPSEKDCILRDNTSAISKPQRPKGNREAVRKYRERKKARTANIEEEVEKLRLVNRQLMIRVRKLSVLETELLRLRRILHGIKEKVDDAELGMDSTSFENVHHLNAGSSIPPFSIGGSDSGELLVTWENNCQLSAMHRQVDTDYVENVQKRLRIR